MPTVLKNQVQTVVAELQESVTEVTVDDVRDEAFRLWDNPAAAHRFLDRPHPLLGGRKPLTVAQQSPADAARVKRLIDAARAGVAV